MKVLIAFFDEGWEHEEKEEEEAYGWPHGRFTYFQQTRLSEHLERRFDLNKTKSIQDHDLKLLFTTSTMRDI
jgi:hypothetical protein